MSILSDSNILANKIKNYINRKTIKKIKEKICYLVYEKKYLTKSISILLAATMISTSLFPLTALMLQQPEVKEISNKLEQKTVNMQTASLTAQTIMSEKFKAINMVSRGAMRRKKDDNIKTIKTPIPVLANNSEKTYMDWRKITNTSSPQYSYIRQHMTVCEDGFLRDKYGNIGVALGSYFGEIGTMYQFVLDTGIVINAVKIEKKADKHTINGYHHKIDNSIIEFVIHADSEALQKHMYPNGYIWQGNFDNCPDFNGKISKIYKIEYIEREMLQHENNRDGDNERN